MDVELQKIDATADGENFLKVLSCFQDVFKGRIIKKVLLVNPPDIEVGLFYQFDTQTQSSFSDSVCAGCRFYPTCSEYSAQALERYNVFKALGLSLIRVLKCHPYNSGGSDSVK
jgi:hypothetical protein